MHSRSRTRLSQPLFPLVAWALALALAETRATAQPDTPTIERAPQPAAAPTPIPGADDREAWATRLRTLNGGRNWMVPFQAGIELTSLAPEDAYDILRENWEHLPGTTEKQNLLKAFFFQLPFPLTARWHPFTLEALDLGVYDPDPEVRAWAFDYARYLSFQDFTDNTEGYKAWRESVAGRTVRDIAAQAGAEYVQRLPLLESDEREREIEWLSGNVVARDAIEVREAMRDAGMLDLAQLWIEEPASSVRLRASLLRIAGLMRADEAFLREVAIPLTARGNPIEIRVAAINALDGVHAAWATPHLCELLLATLESRVETDSLAMPLANALGAIGDPRAIPSLVAYMLAEPGPAASYIVSFYALRPLARVEHDPSRPAAWWREWWEENRAQWGDDPAFASLPTAQGPARSGLSDPGRAFDQRPTLDIVLNNDPMQRYMLIDPGATLNAEDAAARAPEGGYRLLVVLPGGDGSEGHFDFVNSAARQQVPEGFLVVQAVAPQWSTDPQRTIWPLDKLPDPAMKFSTEQFVRAIIGDVSARYPVNAEHVYAMGWSSGGPPVYSLLCATDSPLRGGFIAMSVFRPEWMPPVANAKGRSCFLLHSSEDFIPIDDAARAVEAMRGAGVRATLRSYSGGHGWTEEAIARINIGVRWLMGEEVPDPPEAKASPVPEAFR